MDPVSLVAIIAAAASLVSLLKPLLGTVSSKKARSVRISVKLEDGSSKSIEIPGADQATEAQLKEVLALLKEAGDGKRQSPSKE